jgi:predicted thioesterase
MDFSTLLKPGIEAQKDDTVNDKNTAAAWGSGGIDVYATPSMIALMEGAALLAAQPFLPQGWSTVGTELNVKHLAATPLGMKVYARAELLNIDGRALSFRVEAFDETGKIGEGTHNRFIIDIEKFLLKVGGKKV